MGSNHIDNSNSKSTQFNKPENISKETNLHSFSRNMFLRLGLLEITECFSLSKSKWQVFQQGRV